MPRKKKLCPKIHKELVFNGKYKDFKDFYDINKETIYKSIVQVFEGFKTEEPDTSLSLKIEARIKGLEWDTKFDFKKDEAIVLVRDIMPYFVEVEDYEYCRQIHNLHKDLTT